MRYSIASPLLRLRYLNQGRDIALSYQHCRQPALSHVKGISPEAIARMESELARIQEAITSIQETYGQDHLHLTVVKGYLAKLLGNARVVRYLMQRRPEFLTEF